MNVWDAEHELDADGARTLLAGQFPDLALDSVVHLADGFDNTVFVVDDLWAFRFPRREVAVPLMVRELGVLPALAALLPLPIPVPELVGHAAGDYPWPFWGARLVPGVELPDAGLPELGREVLGAQVGAFLGVLHDPAVTAELGHHLPSDPMHRGTPSRRGPMARTALDRMVTRGSWVAGSATDVAINDLLAVAEPLPPPSGDPVVVHGDLHLRHLLVGPDGTASGVIDWGDSCRADPSVDLSLAFCAFAGAARHAFLDAYGRTVGEERELRARVLAVSLCAALADYADIDGRPALLAESLAGLARAVG